MKQMTPSALVEILDKTIIGQSEAKQAIAIAFRDRYRRTLLEAKYKKWVPIRNVLLKGPSGTSKTELARLIADICDFPFIKIDATSLTSSGYVGGKISTSLRQLVKDGERMYGKVLKDYQAQQSKDEEVEVLANDECKKLVNDTISAVLKQSSRKDVKESIKTFKAALLEYLKTGEFNFNGMLNFDTRDHSLGRVTPFQWVISISTEGVSDTEKDDVFKSLLGVVLILWSKNHVPFTYNTLKEKTSSSYGSLYGKILDCVFNDGDYELKEVIQPHLSINLDDSTGGTNLSDFTNFDNILAFGWGDKVKAMREAEYNLLVMVENYISGSRPRKKTPRLPDELKSPRAFVENYGVVFIDEIDKLIPTTAGKGGHNSTEVQYELLKVVEGALINLDNDRFSAQEGTVGILDTSNILFICAGAFVNVSQDGLISELRGRLPIVINLHPLKEEHLYRILTESNKSPVLAIQQLLRSDKIEVDFTDDALHAIARLAERYNELDEDLGARRLTTILSIVLANSAYEVGVGSEWKKVTIDAERVGVEISKFYETNYHLYKINMNKYATIAEWERFLRVDPSSPLHVERIKRIHRNEVKEFSNQAYRALAVCIYSISQHGGANKDRLARDLFNSLYESDSELGNAVTFVRSQIMGFVPRAVTSDKKLLVSDEDKKALESIIHLVGEAWCKENDIFSE